MQEHNIKLKGTPLITQSRIRAVKVGGGRAARSEAAKTKNTTIKQLTLSVRKNRRHYCEWEPRQFLSSPLYVVIGIASCIVW